jgi:antitoxin ParD1/3/4
LTNELDRFVLQKVKSGRCENASEVVRAALRTLEREEKLYQVKLSALRVIQYKMSLENGFDSNTA